MVPSFDLRYMPFRKKFYIESREIASMSDEDLAALHKELEIKIRGKRCPKPVERWNQVGLSDKFLATLTKNGFDKPFAIQRQTIPAIMAGRDVIGVAKTGSGKTLAFLIPMFRHILDQPRLGEGEGPIGLIMAPARELAVQVQCLMCCCVLLCVVACVSCVSCVSVCVCFCYIVV